MIEAVVRLAAVIDWAWKTQIGRGNQELGVEIRNWAWKAGIERGKLELGVASRAWTKTAWKAGIGLGKLEFDPSSSFEFLQDLSTRIAIFDRNCLHYRIEHPGSTCC